MIDESNSHTITTALIDLHCHSNYSDGLLSPEQLIDLAKNRNIRILSLTDHDTMAGVNQAVRYGKEAGIRVVPGIEFSVYHHDTEIHLLGYNLDQNNIDLLNLLTRIQNARIDRNKKIIANLNSLGYKISQDFLADNQHHQIGRPHIASLMVQNKYVKSEDEAFRRFLRCGAAAYAQRDIITARKAIEVITSAKGLAVLAHPGILGFSEFKLSNLIVELCDIGLSGLEVFHPVNSNKMSRFLANISQTKNLLQTGGSDFHGRDRDKALLGECGGNRKIPERVKEILTQFSQ